MSLRPFRIMIVVAVTALSSGIPQVVMAASDDDCCTEPCDGFDAKRCPPNCPTAVCAKVHASLGAIAAPSIGKRPFASQAVVVVQAAPELPLVVSGLFHPPIA